MKTLQNLLLSLVLTSPVVLLPRFVLTTSYFGEDISLTPLQAQKFLNSSSDDSTFAPQVVAPRGAPSSSSAPPSSDTTFLAFLEDDLSILVAQAHYIEDLLRSNKEHQLVVFAKIAAIISGSQSVAPSVETSSTPPPIVDPKPTTSGDTESM